MTSLQLHQALPRLQRLRKMANRYLAPPTRHTRQNHLRTFILRMHPMTMGHSNHLKALHLVVSALFSHLLQLRQCPSHPNLNNQALHLLQLI